MTDRLLLAAPVLGLVALTIFARRRSSPVDPSIVAVAMTAVVAAFFPLASSIIEPQSWRHGVHLPDESVRAAQVEYLFFAVGLCLAAMRVRLTCASAGPRTPRQRSRAAVLHRDRLVALGLVVGGGLLYALYVWKVGFGALTDRSNFAEKYRASSGLGALYAGINLMILGCLWAEASALPRKTLRLFRLCAAGILLWSVAFIAVRTYAVALFLGYLYLFTKRRGFTVAKVRPSLVLALLLGYVGVESYGLMRSVWHGSVTEAASALKDELPHAERMFGQVVGGSEFSHPFITQMELERFERPGDLGGATYAHALLGLAPLWLAPNRGPSLSQEFARRHYPDLSERGGGTAFSFVGEAWWNFGSMGGPLLVGLVFGWLLMGAERRVRFDPDGALQRFLPYTLHIVLLFHRNSSSSLLKLLFTVALPPALLLGGAALLWGASGRRTSLPRVQPQEAV